MLSEILRRAGGAVPKELIVGLETADNAAVYRLGDRQALVATADFFMPIADDACDFGRIAAANALSDVCAMGDLLVACAADAVADVLRGFGEEGFEGAAPIGRLAAGEPKVRVTP